MSYVKPDGISGLNSGHALFSDVQYFCEFGQLNKELVNDTALTTTAATVNDVDIGSCREFTSAANAITETLGMAGLGQTVVFVHKIIATLDDSDSDCSYMLLDTAGHVIKIDLYNGSRIINKFRGNYGTENSLSAYYADQSAINNTRCYAVTLDETAGMKTAMDGALTETLAATTTAFSESKNVALMSSVGTTATVRLAAIIVFNRVLLDAELQSVTSDPWAMLATAPAITSVDADNEINPSQTDVAVAISNAPASVTSLDQINLGGTVSGETITGGTDMLNLRWNGGTPLFDVPSGMTIANGYDIHVKYTP
jgi:hypothetical protein